MDGGGWPEGRVYRASELLLWLHGFGLIVGTIVAVLLGAALASGNVEMAPLAVLWILVLAFGWYVALSTAYEVHLGTDGVLQYRSLLGRGRVDVADVRGVRKWLWVSPWLFSVRYEGGAVWVFSRMDGLHELLTRLREANPRIRVDGL